MGKVRIYELARELKLESRRIIDDARRMGVDVSVPSNTLEDPIADKIRELYFPKKEPAVEKRTARLVKTVRPAAEASPRPENTEVAAPAEPPVSAAPVASSEPEMPATRLVKIIPPPAITGSEVSESQQPVESAQPEPETQIAETVEEAPASETAPAKPAARSVIPLVAPPRPVRTPSAVEAATPAPVEKPAHPAPAPKPAPASGVFKLTNVRPMPKPATPPSATTLTRPGMQRPGAKGITAKSGAEAPLLPSGERMRTTYVPPKDNRHKGRNSKTKGGSTDKQEGILKSGPVPRRTVAAPVTRTIPDVLKAVRLVEGATVREFAEKLEVAPRDVVTELFQRGVMATINQTLNPEVAKDIAKLFGYEVTFGAFEDMIVESEFEITPEAMEDTDSRAPVITVMGHVDHGKTSLLDVIRSSRVAEGEAGGITQHIGAYSVEVPSPENPSVTRRVVFLDTPGHAAFTMMRARGAKVTDIVILVVAADDGVMPQTEEAIQHAKAANVPIIVAINKVDKPDANPERVKTELAGRGLQWTGWGGDTEMVEVSAKMNRNIDGLLEMILLQADIMELKANPKRMATGTVLEAKLDRGRGSVATVLLQNGTLKIGEPFIVGNFFGKVRALVNDRGHRIEESGPATPVEILGLEGVPAAGDQFQVVADVVKAQQISQYRQSKARLSALARTSARGLDQLAEQMETGEVKELLVILKADVQGSAEVLKETLIKLSTDKVKVRIIRSGVGAITYDDVLLASASSATSSGAAMVIIGFNVRPEARASEAAKHENIDIRLHSIIYKVEEEIRNAMIGMLDATIRETVIGKAEIRDVIRVPKVGSVAGCMVIDGNIKRTALARLIRDNVVIFESSIGSLRRFKEDVADVQQGYECGITIDRFNDYKVGDVIEAFISEKVAATQL
jgi:translation initiation factor IF-2